MLAAPKTSTIYRGEGGGCAPLGFPPQAMRHPQNPSRVAAKGGEGETCPPSKVGRPLPKHYAPWTLVGGGRTSPPGAGPLPHLAHAALRGWWPHLVDPRDPPGGPGTLPKKPETLPVTKTGLPIYKSLPPDHSGTPRDVRDLIRDSEQHSVTTYKLPL